jgi:hypothetical protein
LGVGGGNEEGICTSLICENQDFSVFACLFFPLTAVRMAYFAHGCGAVSLVNVHTMVLENPRVSLLEVGRVK